MASGSALRASALEFERLAGRVAVGLHPLARLAGPATLRGPAADALRSGLRTERARLDVAAGDLRSQASRLRARAEALEAAEAARRAVTWVG